MSSKAINVRGAAGVTRLEGAADRTASLRSNGAAEVTRLDGPVDRTASLLTSAATDERRRGFTLIELIVVLMLLAIAATMVAPRMSSFFRGRALNLEARRMLSLTHYAQSRAVSEAVPVVLWFDPRTSRYGIEVQGAHATAEDRTPVFTLDPTLTLVPPPAGAEVASETDDEKLGLPEGLPVIRFNPDGFFDEISVHKITIQQGTDGALELVQKPNRLGYEILPASSTN
ncbi:MAG: GspH/FimT family pseudopilin [Opitutaceae bacterium]|nr:GspH/FimT family pseudopilin [Opitutaceae bacterium]